MSSPIEREQMEKRAVTFFSAVSAVFLTIFKLGIGLLTGSLGLLAEAVHSAIDLVASFVTYYAVRFADLPPDEHHHFGHGKVENLAAAFEAILLFLTSIWILVESIRRVFIHEVFVELSAWAFVVLGSSIVIDAWRSWLLMQAAKKYRSQAMEADALNFRADMWSSAVVIFGLLLIYFGRISGYSGWWEKADSLAAMIVSLMILRTSIRLAGRAVHVLLDRAPAELGDRMSEAALAVDGVLGSSSVRLRESGNRLFADLTVTVSRNASLAEAHQISDAVESAIHKIDPATNVVVHVEPAARQNESLVDAVRAVALESGMRTHDEKVRQVSDQLHASLHLELDPRMSLAEAHRIADRLEQSILDAIPQLNAVDVHLETISHGVPRHEDITGEKAGLAREICRIAEQTAGASCKHIEIHRLEGETEEGVFDIILHCLFDENLTLREAHLRTEAVEQALRNRYPQARHIIVHAEPQE